MKRREKLINNIAFIKRDKTILLDMIKQSFGSVLPITAIILLLSFTICPVDSGIFLAFVVGALMLVVGMGLFTLGADSAMTPIGNYVGGQTVKKKKLWLIALVSMLVGILITIAEPDLQVLAEQVTDVPNLFLIGAVALGVGIFLAVAMLRTILKIPLKLILLVLYVVTFIVSIFVPPQFVAVAFDSGGVTTGPMSVPFIMALGTGVAAIRNDKKADDDSFGLVALCSVGPILAVMILGMIFTPNGADTSVTVIPEIDDSSTLVMVFLEKLPHYLKEVAIALAPIVAFYFLYMIFCDKPSKYEIIKICVGVVYTYLGLVLFLWGVNVGFMPIGSMLGASIASLSYSWIIVPIGMIVGYFVVAAEPAVHVLSKQVNDITQGSIPAKALKVSLSLGVALAIGLAMLRIYFHFSIYYLIVPGYAIALVLMFFVPDIFTAIAFDSGGVASGAMTASFVLPLALGFCAGHGGDVATEGFGVVAMVALMPLIAIQILGLIYKIKVKRASKSKVTETVEEIIS